MQRILAVLLLLTLAGCGAALPPLVDSVQTPGRKGPPYIAPQDH